MTSSEFVPDWEPEQSDREMPAEPRAPAQEPQQEQEAGVQIVRDAGSMSWNALLHLTLDDCIKQCKPHLLHVRDSDVETAQKNMNEESMAQAEAVPDTTTADTPAMGTAEASVPAASAEAPKRTAQKNRRRGGGGQQKRAWRDWRAAQQRIQAYRARVSLTNQADMAVRRAAQAYSEQDAQWRQDATPTGEQAAAAPWQQQQQRVRS